MKIRLELELKARKGFKANGIYNLPPGVAQSTPCRKRYVVDAIYSRPLG